MEPIKFMAYVAAKEIDLNKIAAFCGLPKKYTWEDPLVLKGETLRKITNETLNGELYIFSFGSLVFVSIDESKHNSIIEKLKTHEQNVDLKRYKIYTDDYALHIANCDEIELTDKYIQTPTKDAFTIEIIATVIAKSVAMEKIEHKLAEIIDDIEPLIDRLEAGKLKINDKKIARVTSKIARYEYNTIAYIMILDKPDITWTNSEAAVLYGLMSEFFELADRYEIIKQKISLLNSVVDGISSTSHTIKSVFVEWIVVLLILLEVVLMTLELFK